MYHIQHAGTQRIINVVINDIIRVVSAPHVGPIDMVHIVKHVLDIPHQVLDHVIPLVAVVYAMIPLVALVNVR